MLDVGVLFPALQRFYGGSWESWESMPIKKLNCYVSMLPVIKAEESLLRYQAMTCGVGPKSRSQAQQMKKQVREWIKTMNRYSGRAKIRKAASFEDMKLAMAAMGIKVKELPRG